MKKIINKILIFLVIVSIVGFNVMGQVFATEPANSTASDTTSPTTEPSTNTSTDPKPDTNTNTNTNTDANTNSSSSSETKPENKTSEETTQNSTTSNTTTSNTTKPDSQTPSATSQSSDCDLKTLTVSEGTLSPAFNKDTISYKIKFDDDYDLTKLREIKIEAQANHPKAIVTGTGTRSVNGEGNTNFQIVVKAEDGKEKIYTLTIEKPKKLSMSDLKLSSLTLDKKNSSGILTGLVFTPAFNPDTAEYTVDVDKDITAVVVYARAIAGIDVYVEGAASDGTYTLSGGKNTIYITLTSEQDDNLVTNYKITVNKPEEDAVATTGEENNSSEKKKDINLMAIVIAIIVVLAVILMILMIANYKIKKANGDYDEDDEDIEETKEKRKKKETKKEQKKNKDNGKRFAD